MINFDKMHGNGNDFIVINTIENTHKLSKSKIKKLSDRNFGIGFDQVISIGPPTRDSFDFSIRFFIPLSELKSLQIYWTLYFGIFKLISLAVLSIISDFLLEM